MDASDRPRRWLCRREVTSSRAHGIQGIWQLKCSIHSSHPVRRALKGRLREGCCFRVFKQKREIILPWKFSDGSIAMTATCAWMIARSFSPTSYAKMPNSARRRHSPRDRRPQVNLFSCQLSCMASDFLFLKKWLCAIWIQCGFNMDWQFLFYLVEFVR